MLWIVVFVEFPYPVALFGVVQCVLVLVVSERPLCECIQAVAAFDGVLA